MQLAVVAFSKKQVMLHGERLIIRCHESGYKTAAADFTEGSERESERVSASRSKRSVKHEQGGATTYCFKAIRDTQVKIVHGNKTRSGTRCPVPFSE